MRNSKYSKEFKDSTVQLILNNNEKVINAWAVCRESGKHGS